MLRLKLSMMMVAAAATCFTLPETSEAQLFSRIRARGNNCCPQPQCCPQSSCCPQPVTCCTQTYSRRMIVTTMNSNCGCVSNGMVTAPIYNTSIMTSGCSGCESGGMVITPNPGPAISTNGATPTPLKGGQGGWGSTGTDQDCQDQYTACINRCNGPACAGVTNCVSWCQCQLTECDQGNNASACGTKPNCLNSGIGGGTGGPGQ